MQEIWEKQFWFLGWENPLEAEMASHSSRIRNGIMEGLLEEVAFEIDWEV